MEGLLFATCRRGDDDRPTNLASLNTSAIPGGAGGILGGSDVTKSELKLASQNNDVSDDARSVLLGTEREYVEAAGE